MIRSTLTAHLAESERLEMTLQVNDRDIGVLATQEQRHYVMSGNRRVQLIAGLQTNPEDPGSVLSTRALLRHWLVSFRELQINGLSRFPVIAERNRLEADFLLLMDSERVLIWCDPAFGVYLHRSRHLYRQQPTYPPERGGLANFAGRLDFYAFRPREGDDLLIIDPAFIGLFDAADLEDLLADIHQINVAMTELTRLALSYGREVDTTWFSAQIQRLETDLEMFSPESRERVAGRQGGRQERPWLGQLSLSKVVPLLDGNVRIDPPGYDRPVGSGLQVPVAAANRPKPPQFERVWQQGREESRRLPLRERGASRRREEGPALPDTYQHEPGLLDRAKHWKPVGFRQRLGRLHRRMTHLVPGSRGLSLLAYVAIWLLVLVLFVALFVALKKDGSGKGQEERPVITAQPVDTETVKTEFEIDIIVRANSLRVVTEAGGEELVGTVTRGDRVVQLAHASEGWVLIRMADGRTGYVPESLLLFPDESDK